MSMNEKEIIAKVMMDNSNFEQGAQEVEASSQAIKDSSAQIEGGAATAAKALEDEAQAISGAQNAAAGLADGSGKAAQGTADLGEKTEQAGSSAEKASAGFASFNVEGIFLAAMAAQAAISFVQLATSASAAADQLSDTQKAFVSLTGNASEANDAFNELAKSAAASDFGQQTVEDAAKQLLLLGEDATTATQEVEKVSDGIAAMGGNGQQLQPIIDALEKLKDSSQVTVQQIDQLASAGLPAWQALASGMGTSVDEAEQRVKDGAVSGSQAFNDMMAGLSQYGGAAQKQADETGATWSKLGKDLLTVLEPVGDAFTAVAKAIDAVISPLVALQQADDRNTKTSNELWDAYSKGTITMQQFGQIAAQSNEQSAKDADALAQQSQHLQASSQATQQATQATAANSQAMQQSVSATTSSGQATTQLGTNYQQLYQNASQASTAQVTFSNSTSAAGQNSAAMLDKLAGMGDQYAKLYQAAENASTAQIHFSDSTDQSTKAEDDWDKALGDYFNNFDQYKKDLQDMQDNGELLSKSLDDVSQAGQNFQPIDPSKVENDKNIIDQLIDSVKTLMQDMQSGVPQLPIGANGLPQTTLPGHAAGGTNLPSGPSVVGERGWEIIDVPEGSNIYSHEDSVSMLSGGGFSLADLLNGGGGIPAGNVPQTINLQIMLDTATIAQKTIPLIAPQIRVLTGSRR